MYLQSLAMYKRLLSVVTIFATLIFLAPTTFAASVTIADSCPQYSVPMSPSSVTTTAVTLTSITISWTPGCGVENTTRIFYSSDKGNSFQEAPRMILPYTSAVIDTLAPNTTYMIYLRGYDSGRQLYAGEISNTITVTTLSNQSLLSTPDPVISTPVVATSTTGTTPVLSSACPTYSVGDLFKVRGASAIYTVDVNGKVYYFPSGDEFKSWNAGEKYSGYTTLSQECFDMMPVPKVSPFGINFRPGSFVVKRPSSYQLYVVEPRNTLAKITPEVAKVLYGSKYSVITIPDVFWPNYVNRGTDITTAIAHPGMLLSYKGKYWYVDIHAQLREVTDKGFEANRFKKAFVRAANDAMVAGLTTATYAGSVIDGPLSETVDRTQLPIIAL